MYWDTLNGKTSKEFTDVVVPLSTEMILPRSIYCEVKSDRLNSTTLSSKFSKTGEVVRPDRNST
jgi:hypothetical protein